MSKGTWCGLVIGSVIGVRSSWRWSRESGDVDGLTVVMEPTRNVWVPVAAYFRAVGAKVVLIAPEQSADLRRYYKKHTKNDRSGLGAVVAGAVVASRGAQTVVGPRSR